MGKLGIFFFVAFYEKIFKFQTINFSAREFLSKKKEKKDLFKLSFPGKYQNQALIWLPVPSGVNSGRLFTFALEYGPRLSCSALRAFFLSVH